MQCLWPFAAQNRQELTLEKGDFVYVTDSLGEWNVGISERTASKGYFPPNFCAKLEEEDIPMPKNDALRKILIFPEDERREAAKQIWHCYTHWKTKKSIQKHLAKIRHRKAVIEELLSGEVKYVKYLAVLKELYAIPLKAKLNTEEYRSIFNHLEVVIAVANTFLEDLEKAQKDETKILHIFVTNSQFLKQYSDFVKNIDSATAVIDSKMHRDREFKNFIKQQRQDKRSDRLDFKSLLAKPFQRLIGYRNLIDRLKQLTPTESFKSEKLELAYQQIELTIEHINEKKRQYDDQQTMIRIQNTLMDKGGAIRQNLIRGWRTPIHEGRLQVLLSDMNHFTTVQAFLMSDIFFFVKDKELSVFYLSFTKITPSRNQHSNTSKDVRSSTSEQPTLVYNLSSFRQKCEIKFKDSDEKEHWMNAFKNAYESEKEYAKESGIQGSIHGMITEYSRLFSMDIREISQNIFEKQQSFEKYERQIEKTNDAIHERKQQIKRIIEEITSYQGRRKNLRVQSEEMRKDFFKLKTEKMKDIERCIELLKVFNVVVRRDQDTYYELFGDDEKWLDHEKIRSEEYSLKSISNMSVGEKTPLPVGKSKGNDSDPIISEDTELHLKKLGTEYAAEMRSIRDMVQGIELEENSFRMIASSAELRKRIQDLKKSNVDLSRKVESLKRVVKNKEEALIEEKRRTSSILDDSHQTDQIKALTHSLQETEHQLVEIQGWKEQHIELMRKNFSENEELLSLKEEKRIIQQKWELTLSESQSQKTLLQQLRDQIKSLSGENAALRKDKSNATESNKKQEEKSSTPKKSASLPAKVDACEEKPKTPTKEEDNIAPPPLPPRNRSSSIKKRAQLFEQSMQNTRTPPPLPARENRPVMETSPSASHNHESSGNKESKPEEKKRTNSQPSSLSTVEKERYESANSRSLQEILDQNDRLQTEILELKRHLEESRKEKVNLIEANKERTKSVFRFQEEQLKYHRDVQERMYQNNKTLSQELQQERIKVSQYERHLLQLQQEKFAEIEKQWDQDRAVADWQSAVEKLRIELLQSHYKIAYLERELAEGHAGSTTTDRRRTNDGFEDAPVKRHRRTSASILLAQSHSPPKRHTSPRTRSARRVSLSINALHGADINNLLNARLPDRVTTDRPSRPLGLDQRENTISPLQHESSFSSSNASPYTPSDVDSDVPVQHKPEDKSESVPGGKRKRKKSFFSSFKHKNDKGGTSKHHSVDQRHLPSSPAPPPIDGLTETRMKRAQSVSESIQDHPLGKTASSNHSSSSSSTTPQSTATMQSSKSPPSGTNAPKPMMPGVGGSAFMAELAAVQQRIAQKRKDEEEKGAPTS